MKRFFLLGITLMVSTAMLMTGCKKDNPQPDSSGNGGGSDTPTEIAANTMVLNGTTYHLNSSYGIDPETLRSYAYAVTVELDANGDPFYTIIADVELNTLNKTYSFPLSLPDDEIIWWAIHEFNNYDSQIGPDLDSGTMTISRTDNLFTYKVDGKTGDQTVSFNISVPASEWTGGYK